MATLPFDAANREENYWLVVWNIFYFPIYIGKNHPNWLSYFSEGWLNHQPDSGWTLEHVPDNSERVSSWNADVSWVTGDFQVIILMSNDGIFPTKTLHFLGTSMTMETSADGLKEAAIFEARLMDPISKICDPLDPLIFNISFIIWLVLWLPSIFFMCPMNFGNKNPNWRNHIFMYFSEGLNPTSHVFMANGDPPRTHAHPYLETQSIGSGW